MFLNVMSMLQREHATGKYGVGDGDDGHWTADTRHMMDNQFPTKD